MQTLFLFASKCIWVFCFSMRHWTAPVQCYRYTRIAGKIVIWGGGVRPLDRKNCSNNTKQTQYKRTIKWYTSGSLDQTELTECWHFLYGIFLTKRSKQSNKQCGKTCGNRSKNIVNNNSVLLNNVYSTRIQKCYKQCVYFNANFY